ncbi:hypothetical protein BJX76DRAFT_163761 [Aspergillus varians]
MTMILCVESRVLDAWENIGRPTSCCITAGYSGFFRNTVATLFAARIMPPSWDKNDSVLEKKTEIAVTMSVREDPRHSSQTDPSACVPTEAWAEFEVESRSIPWFPPDWIQDPYLSRGLGWMRLTLQIPGPSPSSPGNSISLAPILLLPPELHIFQKVHRFTGCLGVSRHYCGWRNTLSTLT